MRSMEDIWAEHRRFIVAVGGGAAALLVAFAAIARVDAEAARAVKENRRIEREIEEIADLLEGCEGHEAGVARALASAFGAEIRAAVELAPRPAFRLPERGAAAGAPSPYLAYHQAIEIVKAARADAVRRGMACPDDLGLLEQPPEERLAEALAFADLVERLLRAALESGLARVESVRPLDVRHVFPGEGGAPAEPAAESGALALRRFPVRLEATGGTAAVARFLDAIRAPGACFEVADARLSRAAGEGMVALSIEAAGISLVPASEARAATASAGGASAPGGRSGLLPRGGGRR